MAAFFPPSVYDLFRLDAQDNTAAVPTPTTADALPAEPRRFLLLAAARPIGAGYPESLGTP